MATVIVGHPRKYSRNPNEVALLLLLYSNSIAVSAHAPLVLFAVEYLSAYNCFVEYTGYIYNHIFTITSFTIIFTRGSGNSNSSTAS